MKTFSDLVDTFSINMLPGGDTGESSQHARSESLAEIKRLSKLELSLLESDRQDLRTKAQWMDEEKKKIELEWDRIRTHQKRMDAERAVMAKNRRELVNVTITHEENKERTLKKEQQDDSHNKLE